MRILGSLVEKFFAVSLQYEPEIDPPHSMWYRLMRREVVSTADRSISYWPLHLIFGIVNHCLTLSAVGFNYFFRRFHKMRYEMSPLLVVLLLLRYACPVLETEDRTC